jgi:CheY-like chemotaxis protein
MNKKITHEIGNYLHQIISYADSLSSKRESSSYGTKIKSAAYKIDALLTDATADKTLVSLPKKSSHTLNYKQFAGLRVLIVDDIVENIYIMESIFKTLSCKIRSAQSGEEALEVFKEGFTPDIVSMDMMMPGIDGFTTTKELKLLGSNAYFIAVSALKNQSHDTVTMFDSWLPKPFTMEHVNGALNGYMIRNAPTAIKEQYLIKDSLEQTLQNEILTLAQNGAYSELKRVLSSLEESHSKEYLLEALKRIDFNTIINSIISS